MHKKRDPFERSLDSVEYMPADSYAERKRWLDDPLMPNARKREYMKEQKRATEYNNSDDWYDRENLRTRSSIHRKHNTGRASVYDKKLANHEWYVHNKRWKKDYNKQYYERNKDYWAKRYQEMTSAKNDLDQDAKQLVDLTAKGYYSTADVVRGVKDGQNYYTENLAELEAARINAERAKKDYDWYMDTHKKMKVTEAWSDGAKMIRDAGKSFLSKFGLKL